MGYVRGKLRQEFHRSEPFWQKDEETIFEKQVLYLTPKYNHNTPICYSVRLESDWCLDLVLGLETRVWAWEGKLFIDGTQWLVLGGLYGYFMFYLFNPNTVYCISIFYYACNMTLPSVNLLQCPYREQKTFWSWTI